MYCSVTDMQHARRLPGGRSPHSSAQALRTASMASWSMVGRNTALLRAYVHKHSTTIMLRTSKSMPCQDGG